MKYLKFSNYSCGCSNLQKIIFGLSDILVFAESASVATYIPKLAQVRFYLKLKFLNRVDKIFVWGTIDFMYFSWFPQRAQCPQGEDPPSIERSFLASLSDSFL